MIKTLKKITLSLFMTSLSAMASEGLEIVEAIPPADACRGLVKVSDTEYRHYSNSIGDFYLVSQDAGKTWNKKAFNKEFPPMFGGVSKEAPSFTQNPLTKEWIRIQAIDAPVFISKGGIDGQWFAVTKDGQLTQDWKSMTKESWKKALKSKTTNLLCFSGISRTPVFVNNGKRIVIPVHRGPKVNYSDDQGLTWKSSANIPGVPNHDIGGVHKGRRWQNRGVGGTITELSTGKLWMLVRTSQDQLYQSFSNDAGSTWSTMKPSPFFGTLTLATTGKLDDGRILTFWNNYTPLPEVYRTNSAWMQEKGFKKRGGEDSFNNRDALHAAISEDGGKTWIGFREVVLDERRNENDYAVYQGSNDRGKHQTEFFQVDKNRVFMTIGQHKAHRKFAYYDVSALYEKSRSNAFENDLDDWTIHTFMPYVKGHCSYNRKPSATLVHDDGKKCLLIKRLDDVELTNPKYEIDYQKGGAAWNFPNGEKGEFSMRFKLNKGAQGTQVSLMDRLFNACDETAEQFSMYTINLKPGARVGSSTLKAGIWYNLKFTWNGSKDQKSTCSLTLNGKVEGTLPILNTSPNGVSYVHMISTAKKTDSGILIQKVEASVK